MTDLTLTRLEFRSDGVFGVLADGSGNTIAHTLEHAYSDTGDWKPKIPAGQFKCVRGQHRLHGMTEDFTTFEITGVPGHTNLLFHAGNYNADSEGCVLVGASEVAANGQHMITASRATFAAFLQLNAGNDTFTLTVVNT